MLAKSCAKKIKGGNGCRVTLFLIHLVLWIAVTALCLVHLVNTLAALALPAIGEVLTLAADLVAPYTAPVFDILSGLLPFAASLEVMMIAVALVWLHLLGVMRLLTRKAYVYCETNVGGALYMGKVHQSFATANLTVDGADAEIAWFEDKDMTKAARARLRFKKCPIALFAKVELPVAEVAPVEEAVAPVAEVAEELPVAEEVVAEEVAPAEEAPAEKPEPEIQVIIREAAEREAARAAAPAVVEEPAPAPVVEAAPVEEAAPVVVETPAPVVDEESEDEEESSEIREMTVNGRTFKVVIRYSRSFTARMSQAEDGLKAYYTAIKNELLSYYRVNSRISWKHDAFNSGRTQLAKLVVRGKNLCVYLALDPSSYEVEKYHHADCGNKSAYAKVPMMVRVKSDLGLRKAKFLIAEMMANYDLEKGDVVAHDYAQEFAYKDTKTLISEGLIKELEGTEIG